MRLQTYEQWSCALNLNYKCMRQIYASTRFILVFTRSSSFK